MHAHKWYLAWAVWRGDYKCYMAKIKFKRHETNGTITGRANFSSFVPLKRSQSQRRKNPWKTTLPKLNHFKYQMQFGVKCW